MANLSAIPIRFFVEKDKYNFVVDNRPLADLKRRDELINETLEQLENIVHGAKGSQPTLNKRLDVSLNSDGTLKSTAIDEAKHLISQHEDDPDDEEIKDENGAIIQAALDVLSPPEGKKFVRMDNAERRKLRDISDLANVFKLRAATNPFLEGEVTLRGSSSIQLLQRGQQIFIASVFSPALIHKHRYSVIPTPITGSVQQFTVNETFQQQSLRVYINGKREHDIEELDFENGTFQIINPTIRENYDEIRVDYETPLLTAQIDGSGTDPLTTITEDKFTVDFDTHWVAARSRWEFDLSQTPVFPFNTNLLIVNGVLQEYRTKNNIGDWIIEEFTVPGQDGFNYRIVWLGDTLDGEDKLDLRNGDRIIVHYRTQPI